MRFRIAPTPSGYLHLGNAFNFILTALFARATGAMLRLRIDDADATRARPEYLDDIFETLHWLGIRWEEGPCDAADHALYFSQGLRNPRYAETIQKLIAIGRVFACDCSRKDMLARSTDGQYAGTCRDKGLPLDTPNTALRLRTPQDAAVSFRDEILGDVKILPYALARDPVIRRRDGLPAYHVASPTDDLDFGITHIVRGEDLLGSTAVQLFIAQCIGASAFGRVQFFHHPLLKNGVGEKLSKSAGSDSLRAMQDRGASVAEVYQRFSAWMKWPRTAENFADATELLALHGFDALKYATPWSGFTK